MSQVVEHLPGKPKKKKKPCVAEEIICNWLRKQNPNKCLNNQWRENQYDCQTHITAKAYTWSPQPMDYKGMLTCSRNSQVPNPDFIKWGIFFFWWDWSLNSGLSAYKAGVLSLKPYLQSILLWLFWTWSLHELFTQASLEPRSSWAQSPK
jgi:hypothetical protein